MINLHNLLSFYKTLSWSIAIFICYDKKFLYTTDRNKHYFLPINQYLHQLKTNWVSQVFKEEKPLNNLLHKIWRHYINIVFFGPLSTLTFSICILKMKHIHNSIFPQFISSALCICIDSYEIVCCLS